jgi:hypothetical protein
MLSPGLLSLRVANYSWPTTLGPDFSKKENGTLDVIFNNNATKKLVAFSLVHIKHIACQYI